MIGHPNQVIAVIFGGLIAIAGVAVSHLFRSGYKKSVINKAVLAEINHLLFILDHSEKIWSECLDNNKTNYPLIPFTTNIYDKHIDKIGVFDKSITGQVVIFYGYIGFINALQSIRNQFSTSSEFDREYKLALQTILDNYRNAFNNAFRKYAIVPLIGHNIMNCQKQVVPPVALPY